MEKSDEVIKIKDRGKERDKRVSLYPLECDRNKKQFYSIFTEGSCLLGTMRMAEAWGRAWPKGRQKLRNTHKTEAIPHRGMRCHAPTRGTGCLMDVEVTWASAKQKKDENNFKKQSRREDFYPFTLKCHWALWSESSFLCVCGLGEQASWGSERESQPSRTRSKLSV